jgi:hypothetical protein
MARTSTDRDSDTPIRDNSLDFALGNIAVTCLHSNDVSCGSISFNRRVNNRSSATDPTFSTWNHLPNLPFQVRLASHSPRRLSLRMTPRLSHLFRSRKPPSKADASRRKGKPNGRQTRLMCTIYPQYVLRRELTGIGELAIFAGTINPRISDLSSQIGLANNVSSPMSSASCPVTHVTAGPDPTTSHSAAVIDL